MKTINWFPGHMAKTLGEIKANLNRIDCVIELADARIARSSRNPELIDLSKHKKRVVVFSKADLADPRITATWQKAEEYSFAFDLRKKQGINSLKKELLSLNQEVIARAKARGRKIRPLRLLVLGIPNSGKSTLINQFVGKNKLETANRPGVTRQLAWLRAGSEFELLDTPGTLWPKLASQEEQLHLALTGAIRDDILPLEDLCLYLLEFLRLNYPEELQAQYKLEGDLRGPELLKQIGQNLNYLEASSKIDLDRTIAKILFDFRRARIGKISLEKYED